MKENGQTRGGDGEGGERFRKREKGVEMWEVHVRSREEGRRMELGRKGECLVH